MAGVEAWEAASVEVVWVGVPPLDAVAALEVE